MRVETVFKFWRENSNEQTLTKKDNFRVLARKMYELQKMKKINFGAKIEMRQFWGDLSTFVKAWIDEWQWCNDSHKKDNKHLLGPTLCLPPVGMQKGAAAQKLGQEVRRKCITKIAWGHFEWTFGHMWGGISQTHWTMNGIYDGMAITMSRF